MAYRQCRRRLWLEVHRPELRDDSEETEGRFAVVTNSVKSPGAFSPARDHKRRRYRCELRRRSAVEPVIGHLKSEHRMGRNYLWHRKGGAINAVLAAAGNFRRLLRWLELLLRKILVQIIRQLQLVPA